MGLALLWVLMFYLQLGKFGAAGPMHLLQKENESSIFSTEHSTATAHFRHSNTSRISETGEVASENEFSTFNTEHSTTIAHLRHSNTGRSSESRKLAENNVSIFNIEQSTTIIDLHLSNTSRSSEVRKLTVTASMIGNTLSGSLDKYVCQSSGIVTSIQMNFGQSIDHFSLGCSGGDSHQFGTSSGGTFLPSIYSVQGFQGMNLAMCTSSPWPGYVLFDHSGGSVQTFRYPSTCSRQGYTGCSSTQGSVIVGFQCYSSQYVYAIAAICTGCLSNCATCTSSSSCSLCSLGYFLASGACSACSSNCATCTSSSSCSQCISGYFLASGACFGCPSGSVSILGYCYFITPSDTWANAQTSCASKGAFLATINSAVENEAISALYNQLLWIGLSRPGPYYINPVTCNSALYSWTVPSTTSFTAWASNNPDCSLTSGEYEGCVMTNVGGLVLWNDMPCSSILPGLCKYSEKPTMPLTRKPTANPSRKPSVKPSVLPSKQPTPKPIAKPLQEPTGIPSPSPTAKPTSKPAGKTTSSTTQKPTQKPTGNSIAVAIAHSNGDNANASSPTAAIIGGAVGGAGVMVLIVGVLVWRYKTKNGDHPKQQENNTPLEAKIGSVRQGVQLPGGKRSHCFISHKKEGSEDLALHICDGLKHLGMKCFFDVDSLQREEISMESLATAVAETCVMIVVLDDKILGSKWCRFEWGQALEYKVPIVPVIDIDKFNKTQRSQIIESIGVEGFSYVTTMKYVEYSKTHRDEAIKDLVVMIEKKITNMQKI